MKALVTAAGGVRKAARVLGVSPGAVSRYQTGKLTMPAELVEKLRAA